MDIRPFQVDLRGVVDLLGRHIYSSPRVYIRELLQNGVDAITARRSYADQPDATWGISIAPATDAYPYFMVADQGIGLTADEVTDLLATVGRSSKRDILDMARTDYLGQFGIGLLSCFMVSDEIRILSQSATGGAAVEWIGSGDGTFQVRPADQPVPIGTQVWLRPRFDTGDLLSEPTVSELTRQYGQYLPVPIAIVPGSSNWLSVPNGSVTEPPPYRAPSPFKTITPINRHPVFLDDDPDAASLSAFARDELGFDPLDVIDLAAPGTGTRGKAFVLPYAPPPNARRTARVYLGRMLLSERVDDLLPDWAFFVRPVVDSTGLTPTASREGIVDDFNSQYTRDQLGASIRRWLMDKAVHSPYKFAAFLDIHERAIKQLVLTDDELAQIFTGYLSVETSLGRLRLDRLVKLSPTIRYARTLDEFRQVVALARDDTPLVNGGYVYDAELLERLPLVYPSVTITEVDILAELDQLTPPDLAERALTVPLEDRATKVLEDRQCQAVVRIIANQDTPALFVADPEVFRHIDRDRAGQVAPGGLWAEILAQTDAYALSQSRHLETGFRSRLCLNWANPVVRALAQLDDDAVFARCVQLLYAQSQLAGSYPLTAADRHLMTTALGDLVALIAPVPATAPPTPTRGENNDS